MSKKTLLVPLAAFGLLVTAAPAAETMLVVLKNGSELRAEVLKVRDDAVVLDLGEAIAIQAWGSHAILLGHSGFGHGNLQDLDRRGVHPQLKG